jgi:hypothetical protein
MGYLWYPLKITRKAFVFCMFDICNDNLGLLKELKFKEKINDEAIRYTKCYGKAT